MRECSATDFIDWQTVFAEEDDNAEKIHWYLAMIAFEINQIPGRIFGKGHGKQLEIKDFLLKFGPVEKPVKKIDPADRIAMSKAVWGMARDVCQSRQDPRRKETAKQIMDRQKAVRALEQRIAQRKREQQAGE